MRMEHCSQNNVAKVSLLSLLAIVLLSCNALKKVDEDQFLIKKNAIYADSIKINNEELESLIYQKPNSKLLGYPLRLNLFNLAKENPDSSFTAWLHKKKNRKKRLNRLLSEKQVHRLGESFLVKGLSNWLKDIGEAPVILDTAKTRRSLALIKAYYMDKGYFKNTTHYAIDSTHRKRKATVSYIVNLGKPYIIDSLKNNISSSAIDSLYFLHSDASFIKEGAQFDFSNFRQERERLTALFRNNGVRNFQESSIQFEITRDSVTASDDQKMNVQLSIGDLKKRGENRVTTSEYKVEKIRNTTIYTDYLSDIEKDSLNSINYEDLTIHYSSEFQIKPKTLANAIFFKKGEVYRDIDKNRTARQLNGLNIFKYPNILPKVDSTGKYVDFDIFLAPKTKYSLGLDFEISRSNNRRLGIGLSSSLLIRNVFKGAENLSVSASGAFGLLSNPSFEANTFLEIGADVTLDFPRIWFPLLKTSKIIPNYALPKTRITVGTNLQNNIGLDKQTFNTVLAYNWSPSNFKKHEVELLNIQYVRNINSNRFFNVYGNTYNQLNTIAKKPNTNTNPAYFDQNNNLSTPISVDNQAAGTASFINDVANGVIPISNTEPGISLDDFNIVKSIEEREQRLTANNLIFTTNYTFNINNREDPTDNQFYQFRCKIESAGNLLSAFSNFVALNKNDRNEQLVFDVPFSQYVKTELDFVKYWDVSRSRVIAMRTFFGIAIPYGNADNIPFVRSYFGGGANDNRAWFPYSLGPGRTAAINDFNEANLKLAFNLEYRFPVVGNIKGALFADAGNIWNVLDNVEDPNATFNGFSSLKDIALGSGIGIRYDFTYFLFRLDLGFKTYNPAETPEKRWFRDYNFANSVLQIGINYPF